MLCLKRLRGRVLNPLCSFLASVRRLGTPRLETLQTHPATKRCSTLAFTLVLTFHRAQVGPVRVSSTPRQSESRAPLPAVDLAPLPAVDLAPLRAVDLAPPLASPTSTATARKAVNRLVTTSSTGSTVLGTSAAQELPLCLSGARQSPEQLSVDDARGSPEASVTPSNSRTRSSPRAYTGKLRSRPQVRTEPSNLGFWATGDGARHVASPANLSTLHDAVGSGGTKQKGCACSRNQCLKLYCECFRDGLLCDGDACTCQKCQNADTQDHEVARRDALCKVKKRGFKLPRGSHCACKKSHCLKKYCECFEAGNRCSDSCKCLGCENAAAPLPPPPKKLKVREVPLALPPLIAPLVDPSANLSADPRAPLSADAPTDPRGPTPLCVAEEARVSGFAAGAIPRLSPCLDHDELFAGAFGPFRPVAADAALDLFAPHAQNDARCDLRGDARNGSPARAAGRGQAGWKSPHLASYQFHAAEPSTSLTDLLGQWYDNGGIDGFLI